MWNSRGGLTLNLGDSNKHGNGNETDHSCVDYLTMANGEFNYGRDTRKYIQVD